MLPRGLYRIGVSLLHLHYFSKGELQRSAAFAYAWQIFFDTCPTPLFFFTGHGPVTAGSQIQRNDGPILSFFVMYYSVHKEEVREAGDVGLTQGLP